MPTNPATSNATRTNTSQTSMKTYSFPVRDGAIQMTFKELQAEANLMLAHIAKEPFEADQSAQTFSDTIFRLTQPQSEKNAANAAQLIGWALLLSVAVENAAT